MYNKPRIWIRPGKVMSKTDRGIHYIDAPTLMRLYGIRPHQCKVLRGLKGEVVEEYDVVLSPSYHGNYELPEKARKILNEAN